MAQADSVVSSAISRRTFLKATASATLVTNCRAGSKGLLPSQRIGLGIVGCGSRGFNLIDEFTALSECRVIAICDVDEFHHRDRDWGKGPAFGRRPAAEKINRAYANPKSGTSATGLRVYSDYRELIARDDVDAVVVATPDHWHARCTFDALQAGKDVYCEKPVTHLFAEGQIIVSEVARCKAVFQTGSQQRSDALFQKAVELTRNGVLGRVKTVEVGLPAGYPKPMGGTKIVQPRTDLDYDFWCGPSKVLPLMQARHHRWWRGHRAYGGGVLMDWIGHHNDVAHWAIGAERSGPTKIESVDWKFPDTEVYNTPEQYTIRCEYDQGITSTISSSNAQGLKIIGTDGWVYVRRGKIEASDARWLNETFYGGTFRTPKPLNHASDFLEAVRSRNECIAPAEIGHRSITPGHLGYVSQTLGRAINWDPQREQIIGDADADRLLKAIEYRQPWQVPGEEASA